MAGKLTQKQLKFVEELIKGSTPRNAYRTAYPACRAGDSTVERCAHKLMENSKVQKEYGRFIDTVIQHNEIQPAGSAISPEQILKELAKIAFAKETDYTTVVSVPRKKIVRNETTGESEEVEYLHKEIVVKDTDSLSEDSKAAISAIKETKYGISIETYDKVKALEMLGKHLGIFKDKLQFEGMVPVVIEDDLAEDE